MAKRKKKKIKIEMTVPEPIDRLRMPKSSDTEKLKTALKKTDIKTAIKSDEIKRFVKHNDKLVLAAVIIIIAAIAGSLVIMNFLPSKPGTVYVPKKVTRTETITVTVPLNLSFDEYLDNSINYEDELIFVTGFLRKDIKWGKGGGDLGTYTYSLVDDFGEELNLTELTASQKSMFPQEGESTGLYKVSGMVRLIYKGFDLEVLDIVQVERPTTQVQRTVTIDEYV